MQKNASSDDKCGIEILMLNTKYARISLERTCNNDITCKPIASKFITTTRNNFFDVAITLSCNGFVVIATIISVVIDLFSFSVMCLNLVKYRHVNS